MSKMEYTFDYIKCQSCTAKIHCESCAREAEELLSAAFPVRIDMKAKTLTADISPTEEDHLLDALEAAGIFV